MIGYHYRSQPMTDKDIATAKEIARSKGFEFEHNQVSNESWCFWIANTYGGVETSRHASHVLDAIKEAGVKFPS